jgi:hypothetical protein
MNIRNISVKIEIELKGGKSHTYCRVFDLAPACIIVKKKGSQ